ncbi:MAG: TolC family protein [Alphaproteobacteria bacterium]|nr:TolC family protein [Alphaproteobacteria bacterium]
MTEGAPGATPLSRGQAVRGKAARADFLAAAAQTGLLTVAVRAGILVVAALAGFLAGPASGEDPPERELTLAQAIMLALENNRDLEGSRLGRLSQRLTLEDAEDEFRPRPSLELSVKGDSNASALSGRTNTSTLGFAPTVRVSIPTGGRFDLNATSSTTNRDTASQSVGLTFSQPLLKDAGTTFGTAALVRARRTERSNVLTFRGTVAAKVSETIRAYRKLIQSRRAVEIAERSLERARGQLEVNRVLIETGRMARQDIVQTEASVAERELSLTVAEGALNDARLALIDILDIDSRTQIEPTEPLRVEPAEFDREQSVETALGNRTDYLTALINLENDELALAKAENDRKWSLALTASAKFGHSGRSLSEAWSRFDDDYGVGLVLGIPIGADVDMARRAHARAKIALRQSRLKITELRQSIEVEVHRAVRDVEVQQRRAELARQARELAERKLENERIKLNAGLSSNFRLVRFEDDLVRSQTSEIDATIAYLNALTALDRVLGTTLDTWGIDAGLPAGGGVEE